MKDVSALHAAEYESRPDIVVRAPGVIQFLGEHTQNCDGLILAAASSFSVAVAVSQRRDSALRFFACDFNERKRTNLSGLKFKKEDRWANYLKAAIAAFQERGALPGGLSISVTGDIPQGQGFGASTAILSACLFALEQLFGSKVGTDEFWKLVLKTEEEFLGGPSTFVEAATIRLAKPDALLLLDSRSRETRAIPFKHDGYSLVITDSRVPRFSMDAELRGREADCLKCINLLTTKKRVVKSLREISPEELEESMGTLPESIRRRTLFVLEEMRRASEAEDALRKRDFATFGRLMARSHDGLRDLYEVSCPEVDWLVKRALELEGTVFSRMTGKGFGGCTVSLIRKGSIGEYRSRMEEYERIFGFRAVVHEADLGGGPSVLN